MTIIEVVAGVIFDQTGRKVLLALRKPEQHQGNLWEFPGGKLEADESPAEGLRRELLEETGLAISGSNHRLTLEHQYPDKHVRLHFRNVVEFAGEPTGLEGQQLRWVRLDELAELAFPKANQAIVDELVKMSTGSDH